MPTKSPPQLVPDLLHEVFLYLVPSKPIHPHHIPLDLFASSLVCKDWYIETRPLLDHYTFFRSLCLDHRYTSHDLRRIADLFIESQCYGLDYIDKIESVSIVTASDPETERSIHAVQTMLALLPKLTKLCIATTTTANIPLRGRYQRQTIRPCLQPVPSHSNITRVHLHDDSSNPNPIRQTHINDIIALLSSRLEHLNLTRVTFNVHTHDTLRLCTALRMVVFDSVYCDELSSVVQSWPELRSFHYAYDYARPRIMSTVHGLVRSCLRLESFTVLASKIRLDPAVLYGDLLHLLTFAPKLTRIHVAHNRSITDDAMRVVTTVRAPRLEHLKLEGCTLFTGVPTPLQDGVWPILKSLSLVGCSHVSIHFVESVVAVCHSLKEIVLPDHLGLRVAQSWLESHGFQCEQGNSWRRD